MCQWYFAMFEWRILLLSVECWHRTGAKTTEQGEGARTTAHGTRGEAGTVWGGDTAGHHGHRGDIRLRIQCSEGKGSNSVEEFQHFVTGVCVKGVGGGIKHFVTVVWVKNKGPKRVVVLFNMDPRFIIGLYLWVKDVSRREAILGRGFNILYQVYVL